LSIAQPLNIFYQKFFGLSKPEGEIKSRVSPNDGEKKACAEIIRKKVRTKRREKNTEIAAGGKIVMWIEK
jgi:hypothetical protein